jgi:predicted O-methyltransferase YrrM
MYSAFQLAKKFIGFYFKASNRKGHGIHSPFVFHFIKFVKNDRRLFYAYNSIEQLRKVVKKDTSVIEVVDYGAGSITGATKYRSIKAIAKSSAKPKAIAQLLFRMVQNYNPQCIIELGTSLGFTSSYLAAGNLKGQLVTLEGDPTILDKARQHFNYLGLNNITTIVGNFDHTLPKLLANLQQVDFAFVDGNHRYQPTVNYFQQLLEKSHSKTILVFDDIHWSQEMESAWAYIQQHDAVRLTIDMFFIGIVVLDTSIKEKQHFCVNW